MSSLFAKLWQTILEWLYGWLGGTATPDASASSAPPPAVVVAEREANASAAVAEAQAQAPRTDEELEERLRKGTF